MIDMLMFAIRVLERARCRSALAVLCVFMTAPACAQESRRPALVVFSSPWSAAHSALVSVVEELQQRLSSEIQVHLLDPAERPELAEAAGVSTVPEFHFFDGRRTLRRLMCVRPIAELPDAVRTVLSGP